ncbi:MAG: hypothetical protein LBE36_03175 [Flavobacteriaceae bacterium]|jgi:hypothetical protein|nr:hypothetical protein [Flavobacteriaceae bacterium]
MKKSIFLTLMFAVYFVNAQTNLKNFYVVAKPNSTIEPVSKTTMDDVILNAWERGGSTPSNIENTQNEKRKIVRKNNVILENINLNANEIGTVYLSFNFLTENMTDKEEYRYHVIQRDSETGEIMGGETFDIYKKPRPAFAANANNQEAEKNEPVTISATEISEPATYNWYDENGNLIYTGKDFTVVQEVTKTYKLEVIALDGFKDYSEVQVKVTPYKFINMAPNPASNEVMLQYDIENASSAYVVIASLSTGNSNNYILDTASSQKTINISTYPAGQYSVVLIVDGQIINSKNLIKN